MSNILDEFTNDFHASKELDDRVMQSARLFLLAKDLGELFTLGIGEATKDITSGRDDSTKKPL